MDEDVAGLNGDDNRAPEEVDAAADEAIEDEWLGGAITRVPRTQRLRRLSLFQGRRGEDTSDSGDDRLRAAG